MDDFNVRKAFLPNPADLFKGKPLERLDPTKFAGSPVAKDKKKAAPAAAPAKVGAKPRHTITHISQNDSNRQTLG
jgi:hypothetical protein